MTRAGFYEPAMFADQTPEMRVKMRQELAEGYCQTALKAEAKRREAEAARRWREAKEWARDAAYYWQMAENGYLDGPNAVMGQLGFDEAIRSGLLEEEQDEGEQVPVSEEERQLKALAVNVGMGVLSEAQQEVAGLYFSGRVKADDVADMQGVVKGTIEVQVRDTRAKWRRLIDVGKVLGQ